MKLNITINHIQISRQIDRDLKKLEAKIKRTLKQTVSVIKENAKSVMREEKTGVLKSASLRRYRASPIRRSAIREALARETGASEKLITGNINGNNTAEVGFAENPWGFDYIAFHEDNKRPTLKKAGQKSKDKIKQIVTNNIRL
jgi:regulator of replication initiation timing